jgi:4-azaleucine resistance transporter AzlC
MFETQSAPKSRSSWLQAISPAFPVVMGYLPIGFAYGVLAVNGGLSVFQTLLMSVIVYAGSAQLIAASLFAQAIQPFSIIATTFIVNLRHLLMSAALAPHMLAWKNSEVAIFSFELTDESFGVHSLRFERGENQARPTILINMICQLAWVAGSLLGAVAGNLIEDVRPFALDYALPAMFIALLVLQIKDKKILWIAIISGALSMLLWLGGATQWNVIIAAILAAALGAGLEIWQTQP